MNRPLVAVSVAAAVATLACQAWIGGTESLTSIFTLWVLLPALATLAIAWFTTSRRPGWQTVLLAVPLALGIFGYVAAGLGPSDAQIGLIFLFFPLWQLVLLAIAAGVAWLVARRGAPEPAKPGD